MSRGPVDVYAPLYIEIAEYIICIWYVCACVCVRVYTSSNYMNNFSPFSPTHPLHSPTLTHHTLTPMPGNIHTYALSCTQLSRIRCVDVQKTVSTHAASDRSREDHVLSTVRVCSVCMRMCMCVCVCVCVALGIILTHNE
jgi:hypothetical protein